MRNWHTVEVTVGAYSWVARATDTKTDVYNQLHGYGYPNKGVLLDGLNIAWEQADADRPVYGQCSPWEADLSVLVPAFADVNKLASGDAVCIKVWGRAPGLAYTEPAWTSIPEPPLALFIGRASDPIASTHPLGTIVSLSCVDYTADLVEVIEGQDAWPQESAQARVDRIGNGFGVSQLGSTSGMPNPTVEARAAGKIKAYDALTELLPGLADRATWKLGKAPVLTTGYLVDIVHDALPFEIVSIDQTTRGLLNSPEALAPTLGTPWATGLPGLLGGPTTAVDIVITPVATPLVNHQAFDACNVKFDVDWQYRRGESVEAVVITHDDVPVSTTWTDGTPPPSTSTVPVSTYVQDSQATTAAAWADVAGFLTPDLSENGWAVDKVTLVDLDPATEARRLLLMISADGPGLATLGRTQPVVIYGLPARHSPDGKTWFGGSPVGCKLTFAKGSWELEVSLSRRLPRSDLGIAAALGVAPSDSDGYLSCDNLRTDPIYSATRPVDVVRTVTPYDLRIVRSHDA